MIKTFRAKSIQEALRLVRRELGDDAAVLHTRRLNTGIVRRLLVGSQVEVAAAAAEPAMSGAVSSNHSETDEQQLWPEAGERVDDSGIDLTTVTLREHSPEPAKMENLQPAPTAIFDAFTALMESEVAEPISRELLDELRRASPPAVLQDRDRLFERLQRAIADQFHTSGPIRAGRALGPENSGRRVAALVGPTGVGKTTTIAKLAANFRLREKLNVGLITVDTYRVAAVEQLRTYADIIDLPMEVVATPREMREAIEKFADLDLVLLDTAGRSPRDEVKLQELKSVLGVAQPDEVYLVLSATTGAQSLLRTVEQFAPVGVNSLLITKLDEAPAIGHLLTLARNCDHPVSYLTNGQNVPDDIAVASSADLAKAILQGAA